MSALFKRAPREALAILGFHNITPTPSQPLLSPDFPRQFAKLLRLAKRRYDVVTVAEGYRRLASQEPLKRPMLAFIFDDGYADMHETIMPLMRAEGLVGTSYVVVESLEEGRMPWYEEFAELVFSTPAPSMELELEGAVERFDLPPRPEDRVTVFWDMVRRLKSNFDPGIRDWIAEQKRAQGVPARTDEKPLMMTVEQARELIAAGFEVGCHSYSHPILPTLDMSGLRHEIADSRTRLEALLDHEVQTFCYPNGDNDERCHELVEEAGYLCAPTMACGANLRADHDAYRLKRAAMSEEIRGLWPYHTIYRVHASLVEEASRL